MPPVLDKRADDMVGFIKSIVGRDAPDSSPQTELPDLAKRTTSISPTEVERMLTARSKTTDHFNPGQGTVNPGDINMEGLFALFAILGAAMVLAAIWFFFWAKNGGFIWRKGDWEEYKSTVLRRKDSHGRTLTDATKSTDLGGGSIVGKGFSDYTDDRTEGRTVDDSTVAGEKPKRKGFRQTAKRKLLRKRKDEKWEGGHDDDVRAYRHEKPARVGGLNREAEGTYYGTEYTGTYTQPSEYTGSELNGTEAYYDNTPPRQRDVSGFSFAPGEDTASNVTEEHHLRDPSSRRRGDRHSSHRPRGPRSSNARTRHGSPRKRERSTMPGGYTAPLDMSSASASEYQYGHVDDESDADMGTGTRSYHHPIPGLSKGYRRANGGRGGRRDSLSESDGDDYDSRLS